MLIKGNVAAEWFAFINDEQFLQVSKRRASIIMEFGGAEFSISSLPNIGMKDVLNLIIEWYGSPSHFLQAVESRCSSIT